jgi:hypothetical protein
MGRLALTIWLASFAACAAHTETVLVPTPVEIPRQPVGEVEPVIPPPFSLDDGPVVTLVDAGKVDLPVAWKTAFGQTRPYAVAMTEARATRAAWEKAARSVAPNPDGGTPSGKPFEDARALLERGSRGYAAAYHAPDATPTQQLDAIREAAEMILAWSKRLTLAGLADTPPLYRSDPSIALTFEDVAHGPVRRWLDEGTALLELCVQEARLARLDTPAARTCTALAQPHKAALAKRASGAADGGRGANGCACAFGDPLCSASMSTWCHPD